MTNNSKKWSQIKIVIPEYKLISYDLIIQEEPILYHDACLIKSLNIHNELIDITQQEIKYIDYNNANEIDIPNNNTTQSKITIIINRNVIHKRSQKTIESISTQQFNILKISDLKSFDNGNFINRITGYYNSYEFYSTMCEIPYLIYYAQNRNLFKKFLLFSRKFTFDTQKSRGCDLWIIGKEDLTFRLIKVKFHTGNVGTQCRMTEEFVEFTIHDIQKLVDNIDHIIQSNKYDPNIINYCYHLANATDQLLFSSITNVAALLDMHSHYEKVRMIDDVINRCDIKLKNLVSVLIYQRKWIEDTCCVFARQKFKEIMNINCPLNGDLLKIIMEYAI